MARVELYDGPHWAVADPIFNALDDKQGRYVAFRVLTPKGSAENSQRFVAFDKRIEVRLGTE